MYSANEIEQIVNAVLNRLRSMNALPAPATSATSQKPVVDSAPKNNAEPKNTAELNLPEKLVTLELLRNRLEGVTSLRVLSNAIVTPAVVDELRDRGIELLRRAKRPAGSRGNEQPAERADFSDFLFVVESESYAAGVYPGQAIKSHGNQIADTKRIAAHINGGGKAAIWCATKPYAAQLAAASSIALRPVYMRTPEEFQQMHKEVAPNVIVVDATSWNKDRIVELANSWRANQ